MKIAYLWLSLTLLSCITAAAQDTYYTRDATLTLNGAFNGQPITLYTRQLGVMLDYETAFLIIRFPVSSLVSGIDSLDQLLRKSNTEVVFDGKLGLEYIKTDNHPPMKFSAEGWLSVGDAKTLITGQGELHHLDDSGQIACMLGMTMNLNFDQLKVPLPLPGLAPDFEAVIKQAVLKKDKN